MTRKKSEDQQNQINPTNLTDPTENQPSPRLAEASEPPTLEETLLQPPLLSAKEIDGLLQQIPIMKTSGPLSTEEISNLLREPSAEEQKQGGPLSTDKINSLLTQIPPMETEKDGPLSEEEILRALRDIPSG